MPDSYLESLYTAYHANPQAVSPEWQRYFESIGQTIGAAETMMLSGEGAANSAQTSAAQTRTTDSAAQNNVSRLIQAYRYHGHRFAHTNPVRPARPKTGSQLALEQFQLTAGQLSDVFATADVLPQSHAPLRDILAALEATYCGTLAVQLGDIAKLEERRWLRAQLEARQSKPHFSPEIQRRIYKHLYRADAFEQFLHKKFVGQKRFSIEGADSLIPMLNHLCHSAAQAGVRDIVLGMAHRGRLNVLVNIMHKPLAHIMAAFMDKLHIDDPMASGDVKYHAGYSNDFKPSYGGSVHLSLLSNPSHLEAVNPVVLGSARAKQERYGADGRAQVLPLLIHGDSAFAGQGVVPESLNLANLASHTVGGTVHVVINNQVGFTAEPAETFSGEYCTDIARMLQIPIFHVNGDDPEACVYAMQLAFAYRQQFHKDVVIDLVCYRRYGHNEGDDPTFTQPILYEKIQAHPRPVDLYSTTIQQTVTDCAAIQETYQSQLQAAYTQAEQGLTVKPDMFGANWQGFARESEEPDTCIPPEVLTAAAHAVHTFPEGFQVHPKIQKLLTQRSEMLSGQAPLNWGAGEIAAYAALLQEGYSIRLIGQDAQRGTFSHRHAVQVDVQSGQRLAPIAELAQNGAQFQVYNSCLSELAVLGYEFGYSLAAPNTLTIWEAQFGDFANGAQIVIDQFISSTETKWQRLSGLVLLLPHGFEGQGPEHSSARLERYLQLCGDGNMTVVMPTTPAQICHVLRRQMLRKSRKPLVVMTPKSLLRLPAASSEVRDLIHGAFQNVLDDSVVKPQGVKRVVLCSGKVYYDLMTARDAAKQTDVAIVRLEQLHPLPTAELLTVLRPYQPQEILWVQEEPRNQGAWTFLLDNLVPALEWPVQCISRPASASPAVGSPKVHAQQQQMIVQQALGLANTKDSKAA